MYDHFNAIFTNSFIPLLLLTTIIVYFDAWISSGIQATGGILPVER